MKNYLFSIKKKESYNVRGFPMILFPGTILEHNARFLIVKDVNENFFFMLQEINKNHDV